MTLNHDEPLPNARGRRTLHHPRPKWFSAGGEATLETSMSELRDIRATRTRPFATTVVDPTSAEKSGAPRKVDPGTLPGVGDVVGVHYRLVEPLGEGNFGKVYLAERIDVPEHHVALKILPKSLYTGRNVERELVMLATVGHPHMVQMKDHGMTDSYVWLTMPVYEGETLEQRLGRGTLSLREAYDIFLPIARAVEALHQAGLRHQDIKPDNIYLARFAGRLHPVLLDLGVAAEIDANFIAGTALFAAPEQLLAIIGIPGALPLTEKMDTYCFGATLLIALVGEKRFPGAKARTRDEIVESHATRANDPLHAALPHLQGKPREMLEEKLQSWMALAPDERPTISEVAEGLDVLLEPEREIAREADRAREAQRKSLWRTRVGAVVFLLVAIGLGAVGLYKRQTIKLAGELERARKEGARSFDKLDSCTASFAVEHREHESCESERERDRSEHATTMAALAKDNGGCVAITAQLQDIEGRLTSDVRTCREDLRGEKITCETDTKKLTSEFAAERTALTQERLDCEQRLESREDEVSRLTAEKDACDAARATCQSERDSSPKNPAQKLGQAAIDDANEVYGNGRGPMRPRSISSTPPPPPPLEPPATPGH